jgi:hypothetical protein
MSRISVFVSIALLAGFAIGYFARGAGHASTQVHAQGGPSLAAIEKVQQEEIEATLTQDPKRLIDLWAEAAVAFNPGSPACGRQAGHWGCE